VNRPGAAGIGEDMRRALVLYAGYEFKGSSAAVVRHLCQPGGQRIARWGGWLIQAR
jgi:hypothetical protein